MTVYQSKMSGSIVSRKNIVWLLSFLLLVVTQYGYSTSPACHTNLQSEGIVLRITNPVLNKVQPIICTAPNASSGCPQEMQSPCDLPKGFILANDTSKYYNVSKNATSVAFVFWSTQPLSFHKLKNTPMSVFVPLTSTIEGEPAVTVPVPSTGNGPLCDSENDCEGHGTKCTNNKCIPTPPSPPSPPVIPPPISLPAASVCNITGSYRQTGTLMSRFGLDHSEDALINISQVGVSTYDFVCVSKKMHCFGGVNLAHGTITLSTTDNTLILKPNTTSSVSGLVNNTLLCNLITIIGAGTKGEVAPFWQSTAKPSPPPFDLKVNMASYLGTPASPFVPVAAAALGATRVVIAGNGPALFKLQPYLLLNASSSSNGTLLILDISSSGELVPAALIKLGDRLDHVRSNSKQQLAVAGSFGVALITVSSNSATVVYNEQLSYVEPGSCGVCCDGTGHSTSHCRVSVGDDGTVAATIPSFNGASSVISLDTSGKILGGYSSTLDFFTDVEVFDSNKMIIFTYFYNSDTGHEPMVMPSMIAMDYTLSKEIYRDWWWGSGHPYRQPGPCNGNVADSRAELVEKGKDGDILFVGRSDGGNGVYQCQTQDVNRTTTLVSYDDYTQSFNMQAQAISFLGKMKLSTGQITVGQYNLVRLPSGSHGGNTIQTKSVAQDPNGVLYYAQTSACCIQNMANLTINGQALLQSGDGVVLQAVSASYQHRLLWHHFALPTQTHGSSSSAVEVVVVGNTVVLVAIASQQMITHAPLSESAGPPSNSTVPLGYIVALPTVNQ
eukprot:m.38098 g.38098  ORF g.38098 m.38098 type:complete len:782 (-) comp9387_c0_seq3:941-3286(-)